MVNKSNLKKFDTSKFPSWLLCLLQESIRKRNLMLSLKQIQILSQEYASLSGSSADLKDWQYRIMENNELTKKVLT